MDKYFETGKHIIEKLNASGFEAYFVGGYVRDKLLNIVSDDIDITTNALPEDVIDIFDNVKNTGAKYGSVTVLHEMFKFEVTTYRSDGDYLNNRHPENVDFSVSLDDDLARRDFTMNAICLSLDDQIIDKFNGISDIKNKIIRTINNPLNRFEEDALRILRAMRFVSKLGFDIETKTFDAIKEKKGLLKNISIERVIVELDKIFRGKYRNKAIKYMNDTGVSEVLYGLEKGLRLLEDKTHNLYPLEIFTLCFILEEPDEIWKFSNKNMRLMRQVMNIQEVTKNSVFNKLLVYSNKLEPCLIANKINVVLGYNNQEELIRKIDSELPIKDVCDMKFKGQDILWLSEMKRKSDIGVIVDELKYNVIMGYMKNDYEELKVYAMKRIKDFIKDDKDE
ncbi:CCA tRNA nucleotidyltransferase [Candidatus Izimaplasma bacterium ZiA1]|uniref:CCA tRNA nucleotidyltransferase n=1 Tax=Candidatus Izimoplasma sp. ZiA1 TaxID=2024899 RepID=UPI000BAA63F6|nr:CCA tRNA nucleotidyltransferase [Candidatus Izimaplasma bacterium ZiA1]